MKIFHRVAGVAIAAAVAALSSCYPFMGALPPGAAQEPTIQHVPYSGTFSYSVDTGSTPRDVYFVFTNPSTTADLSASPTFSVASITVNGKSLPAPVPQALPRLASTPRTINERVAEFNRDPRGHLSGWVLPAPHGARASGPSAQTVSPAGGDTLGAPSTFYAADPNGSNSLVAVSAHCRAIVGPVTFADGRKRTLSMWVDNAIWNTDVDQTKVDDLAAEFLKTTEITGDIYHWDTAVVGEPWGPQGDPSLIAWDANNTITILLTHLNPASAYAAGSVTVGYFWAKDNYSAAAQPGSNERIMFYIDSELYGNTFLASEGGPWAPTNFWPELVFSTLAHEFQHMIQFYQKQVLRGALTGTDAWINEMCSMIMEDLVADKLNVEGPRGVVPPSDGSSGTAPIVDGRIPFFNPSPNLPLVVTSNPDSTDYSVFYAFGAWLARNYGGAELLRRIVQCIQTDQSAVVNAVIQATGNPNESLTTLLERWAASVLLSDSTTTPTGYKYNIGGWFTSSLDGESYNLGSIDFHKYDPSLTIYTPAGPAPSTTPHSSNIYYRADASLTGSRTWNITLPPGVLMNVVVR